VHEYRIWENLGDGRDPKRVSDRLLDDGTGLAGRVPIDESPDE
jgi:hypothetical protein